MLINVIYYNFFTQKIEYRDMYKTVFKILFLMFYSIHCVDAVYVQYYTTEDIYTYMVNPNKWLV
jgi:hypothetical protein